VILLCNPDQAGRFSLFAKDLLAKEKTSAAFPGAACLAGFSAVRTKIGRK
jgi:hypothetical protein